MKNTMQDSAYWWSIPVEKLLSIVHSDSQNGLSHTHVKSLRKRFGSNTILETQPTRIYELILESIKEPMMLLLLSIAGLSLLFGKKLEAIAMVFVVIAYIIVECINKYRVDRVMSRLRSLTQPTVQVLRDGKEQEIPTKELVVGDIILLNAGTIIPADARLITSYALVINEAALTGESLPISKQADIQVPSHAPLFERINSVFAGTVVISGQAKALVMAVGKQSQWGKIATETQKAQKEKTVLQNAMTKLAKVLALFALGISLLIPAIGVLKGLNFHEMVLTWLALTFLMIPGQPPIIITMALALAAFELAKRKVIVKRLHGVETIGQVTAIVSDKTGTLTENTMVTQKFILANGQEVLPQNLPQDIQEKIAFALPIYSNDPTDKAVSHALDKKYSKILDRTSQIQLLKDFSAQQPWRIVLYTHNASNIQAIAGNPELLIDASTLSAIQKKQLKSRVTQEAQLGKRVIAYAVRHDLKSTSARNTLENIQLIALALLEDPVRDGVKDAITLLHQAGITTIIVSGDHPATVQAIAHQVGIPGTSIEGERLEHSNNQELDLLLSKTHIFARTGPFEKLRLVKFLESRGAIVGVIGDGINDALALKAAQVGIAMGTIGTDLAKEVSDLILTDDSYIHIPQAVALGRKALSNFKKGLTYYLSAKTILLGVFLVPLALGTPFPFAPIHLILIELLMDLASSTIFVIEQAEPDIMKKPFSTLENYLGVKLIGTVIYNSLGLIIALLALYLGIYYSTHALALAQTAALVTWLIGHIALALTLKQDKITLVKQGLLANRVALAWLIAMILLSICITSVPSLYPYLHTTHLSLKIWLCVLAAAFVSAFWVELRKIQIL